MGKYLLFQLYGPLQSWGPVAVGEIRPTEIRPTRSGVLGLLCAALGIRRGQEDALHSVHEGYNMAVRVDKEGSIMQDYHSVQYGKEFSRRIYRCRRDELGGLQARGEKVQTVLSVREYLQDACFTVCIQARDNAPYTLNELVDALERPKFSLYLGRRACPPSWPLWPLLVEAEGLEQALNGYKGSAYISMKMPGDRYAPQPFASQESKVVFSDTEPDRYKERLSVKERKVNHAGWYFDDCPMYRFTVGAPAGGAHVVE